MNIELNHSYPAIFFVVAGSKSSTDVRFTANGKDHRFVSC